MSKEELGYQTTIRQARGEHAHLQFARAVSVREKLLAAALPVLWALVVVVVVAALWWA
jgi:hypothetical protein